MLRCVPAHLTIRFRNTKLDFFNKKYFCSVYSTSIPFTFNSTVSMSRTVDANVAPRSEHKSDYFD